jgi:hypothetical protein
MRALINYGNKFKGVAFSHIDFEDELIILYYQEDKAREIHITPKDGGVFMEIPGWGMGHSRTIIKSIFIDSYITTNHTFEDVEELVITSWLNVKFKGSLLDIN